jgi:hypothetical protein
MRVTDYATINGYRAELTVITDDRYGDDPRAWLGRINGQEVSQDAFRSVVASVGSYAINNAIRRFSGD